MLKNLGSKTIRVKKKESALPQINSREIMLKTEKQVMQSGFTTHEILEITNRN